MSSYRCPVTPLGFYLVPAQRPLPLIPLRGSAHLPGASACLAPACWSAPGVGLGGSLLRSLVFSHVPCSSSGPAACVIFPAAGFCTLCQGAPVALVSAWVDGEVTLLPFPYLRVGVLLAFGVSGAGYNFSAMSCTAAPRDVCHTRLAALTPDP